MVLFPVRFLWTRHEGLDRGRTTVPTGYQSGGAWARVLPWGEASTGRPGLGDGQTPRPPGHRARAGSVQGNCRPPRGRGQDTAVLPGERDASVSRDYHLGSDECLKTSGQDAPWRHKPRSPHPARHCGANPTSRQGLRESGLKRCRRFPRGFSPCPAESSPSTLSRLDVIWESYRWPAVACRPYPGKCHVRSMPIPLPGRRQRRGNGPRLASSASCPSPALDWPSSPGRCCKPPS